MKIMLISLLTHLNVCSICNKIAQRVWSNLLKTSMSYVYHLNFKDQFRKFFISTFDSCLLLGCIAPGKTCWSSSTGVVSGGCCGGTQCAPWLPSGGTWDGSSAWYCLFLPKLPLGTACNYVSFKNKYNDLNYSRNAFETSA